MIQKDWNPFGIDQWIAWCGATAVASITCVVFFYTHFETKVDSDQYHASLEHRLERMESKIDQLLEAYNEDEWYDPIPHSRSIFKNIKASR